MYVYILTKGESQTIFFSTKCPVENKEVTNKCQKAWRSPKHRNQHD